jgi:hypothetical protein
MLRPRAFLLPLAVLILGVLVWTGWWFYASRMALATAQDWVVQTRADGFDVGFAKFETGGYPFRVTLTAERLGLAAPLRAWSVSTERVEIGFSPVDWTRYTLTSDRPIQITAAALPGSRETPLRLSALDGTYTHDAGAAEHRLRLRATGLSGPEGLRAAETGLRLVRPFRPAAGPDDSALRITLELVEADLPQLLRPPLPADVPAAVLEADIRGPEPDPEASLLKRLALWQQGGGRIEVARFDAVWADVNLQSEGTLGLDAAMRPLAAFSVRATGLSRAARRAEEAGLIDAAARQYIELGAGLLSGLSGGNNDGSVRFPVTAHDGVLSLGPVGLTRLPSLIPGYTPRENGAAPGADSFTVPAPPPTVSDVTLNAGE